MHLFCSHTKLISGHFEFGDSVMRKQVGAGPCSSVQLPLAIAAVAGATHSIKALLQAGVCPRQVDCHGNNVVHSMIAFLHYHSEMEEAIISTFQLLVETLNVDMMRAILHHENSFGLRPIEFAAQHGQGSMVLAIMNTPGVYLRKEQVYGLTTYKWYDITEYESTGSNFRNFRSPLLLMSCVDSAAANTNTFCKFIESSAVQAWYAKKYRMNLPIIFLWFLIRALFVAAYILLSLDMGVLETTRSELDRCIPGNALILAPSIRFSVTTYLVTQACMTVLFDIGNGLQLLLSPKYRPLFRMVSGKKNLLAQITYYRVCYFFFCFFIMICAPAMYGMRHKVATDLVDYSRVVTPFTATWSLLYFMQLVPKLGFSISSVYRMIKDLGVFILMYMVMIIPFVQAFYTFINTNTMQGCIPGFNDLFQSFYSMFLVMLNMIPFTGLDIDKIELLYLTHMVYTFGISIFLVNFFIAVMSDSMAHMSRNQMLVEYIQKSSVAFSVEHYVKWCLKPVYNFMIKRFFVVDDDNIPLIESTHTVA